MQQLELVSKAGSQISPRKTLKEGLIEAYSYSRLEYPHPLTSLHCLLNIIVGRNKNSFDAVCDEDCLGPWVRVYLGGPADKTGLFKEGMLSVDEYDSEDVICIMGVGLKQSAYEALKCKRVYCAVWQGEPTYQPLPEGISELDKFRLAVELTSLVAGTGIVDKPLELSDTVRLGW